MMNRQARMAGTEEEWISYGEVTYIEAGRRRASTLHARLGTWTSRQTVEVRDEFDGLPPVTFEYWVGSVAHCLNPRLGS